MKGFPLPGTKRGLSCSFEVHSDERYFEFSLPKKRTRNTWSPLSVKLNSRLRTSQALDRSLLANWEVEVTLTQDLPRTGLEESILSGLLLKKVLTEMKSSQVFPCECFRHGHNSERGWLLLPALTPAGLRTLLPQSKVGSNFLPPEHLASPPHSVPLLLSPPKKPPQSLTHCPKPNPALSLRGHHLPPPACFVRLSVPLLPWPGAFPSIQNNPQFPLLLPKSCGDQSRPGCTFPPGPKGSGTRPLSSIKFILQKGCFSQSRVQTVAN